VECFEAYDPATIRGIHGGEMRWSVQLRGI
jgi:hypothetical protein